MSEIPQTSVKGIRARVYSACLATVAVVAVGLVVLFVHRRTAEAKEREDRQSAQTAGPVVRTEVVEIGGADRVVPLIGEVRAYSQATLYAKVSGYVRRMLVDKGDRVREGQILAELEVPEVAQQVAAAQADLALKEQLANRARELAPSGVVAAQDLEQAEGALKVAVATLAQARANQAYATLRAPFAGYVTARFVDAGALLSAATGSTSGAQPMLELADMDRVRVQVYLPQAEAMATRENDTAELELEDGSETATVGRVTRRLDPRTRTMLAELIVPNLPRRMYPGQFVRVRLHQTQTPRPSVRADALVFGKQGVKVALLEGNHIRLVPVTPGEDDGTHVVVLKGLNGGERVVLNASGLRDGDAVQVAEDGRAAP
jgi:membrane fusion protein, multidrug efflux system